VSSDERYPVIASAGWNPSAPETLAAENILYPELAAHGQLATALQAAAAGMDADVGVVAPDESDPRRWALVDSRLPDRKPLGIGIGAVERWFLITGWSRGVQLLSGATPDLGEVVRAAAGWRRGASLDQIQAAASFVEVSSLARAHECGPAEAVAEQWRLLRASWNSEDQFRFVAEIIEAAYAAPALRQLFPYTSHAAFCLSTCTGYPYSDDIPPIVPRDGGGYVLLNPSTGAAITEVDDAESAVAALLAHLPANVGPAVAGTADRA
jgi:hypothetical protein